MSGTQVDDVSLPRDPVPRKPGRKPTKFAQPKPQSSKQPLDPPPSCSAASNTLEIDSTAFVHNGTDTDDKYKAWRYEYTPTLKDIYLDAEVKGQVQQLITNYTRLRNSCEDAALGDADTEAPGPVADAAEKPFLAAPPKPLPTPTKNCRSPVQGVDQLLQVDETPPKSQRTVPHAYASTDFVPVTMLELPPPIKLTIKPITPATINLFPSLATNPFCPTFANSLNNSSTSSLPRLITHGVFNAQAIPRGSYIASIRGSITSDLAQIDDGLVKDSRQYGNKMRFVRNGCHSNAPINIIMIPPAPRLSDSEPTNRHAIPQSGTPPSRAYSFLTPGNDRPHHPNHLWSTYDRDRHSPWEESFGIFAATSLHCLRSSAAEDSELASHSYPISPLVNERSQALELQIGCSDVDVFGADDLWMREKENEASEFTSISSLTERQEMHLPSTFEKKMRLALHSFAEQPIPQPLKVGQNANSAANASAPNVSRPKRPKIDLGPMLGLRRDWWLYPTASHPQADSSRLGSKTLPKKPKRPRSRSVFNRKHSVHKIRRVSDVNELRQPGLTVANSSNQPKDSSLPEAGPSQPSKIYPLAPAQETRPETHIDNQSTAQSQSVQRNQHSLSLPSPLPPSQRAPQTDEASVRHPSNLPGTAQDNPINLSAARTHQQEFLGETLDNCSTVDTRCMDSTSGVTSGVDAASKSEMSMTGRDDDGTQRNDGASEVQQAKMDDCDQVQLAGHQLQLENGVGVVRENVSFRKGTSDRGLGSSQHHAVDDVPASLPSARPLKEVNSASSAPEEGELREEESYSEAAAVQHPSHASPFGPTLASPIPQDPTKPEIKTPAHEVSAVAESSFAKFPIPMAMNQSDSHSPPTRRGNTLKSPTFFSHTDIQAQLQTLLPLSLTIDSEHLDQLAAIIRNIHLSKQQDAFLKHLTKFIQQKDAEIESVARGHYQDFLSSVDKLLSVRQGTISLNSHVLSLDRSLQSSGTSLAAVRSSLLDARKVSSNIQETIDTLQSCLKVLDLSKKLSQQISERKFYSALRSLDELQFVHLKPLLGFAAFAGYLGEALPNEKMRIREEVTKQLNLWLYDARQLSQQLSRLALEALELRDRRWKTRKERLSSQDTASIALLVKFNTPVESAVSERHTYNVLESAEASLIDFNPLYLAIHIHETLDAREELQKSFRDDRRAQAHLILASMAGNTSGSSVFTLDSLGALIEQIVGFFIIEAHILWTTRAFRDENDVDALWQELSDRIIKIVRQGLAGCEDLDMRLGVKTKLLLFSRTLESYNYPVTQFHELFGTLASEYTDLLFKKFSIEFGQFIQEDDHQPTQVNNKDEFSKVVDSFPAALPFSQAYPLCCIHVRNYVPKHHACCESVTRDADDSIRKSLDSLLISHFGLHMVDQLDQTKNLSQLAQIVINTLFFLTACDGLEAILTQLRVSARFITPELEAKGMFGKLLKTAEQILGEIQEKIQDLFELSEYDWRRKSPMEVSEPPDAEGVRVNEQETSIYLRECLSFIDNVLVLTPREFNENIFFGALRFIGERLKPLAPVEGLATIQVSASTLASGRRSQDILADLIEQHQLPIDFHFKLFHRIRIAMALRNPVDICRFAVVRLLALAIYADTTDETTAISKLFIYEAGLISQLSELINLKIGGGGGGGGGDGLGGGIQAAAFYALEGISRYCGKIAEVADAVEVSVSHGTLMQVVRKMAKELELIRVVTNLDGLLYGFTSAFILFNQVDGLKVFVNQFNKGVDKAYAEHHVDITSSSKPSELLIGMLSHSSV
ncbi:hypothetical protein PCANC_16027 [Puccinia coronata f. sp. avenae]|uniref:Uncharacterized protein n=1 Tax=Puccinia coronata f. sp. avenae TaxID=200324 RepID=A0A2N5ULQ6_9BASI|nr:hypothetical protein PCANC_16027 [Puccinia coronata f. sp. avenae]